MYDTGALVAAERSQRDLWALHRVALQRGSRPLVPAAVLAQAWRGRPQPNLSRLLAGCLIVPLDESGARATGAVLGAARTANVVDASVVVVARSVDAAIVTSDPDDLERLLGALSLDVPLHRL